MRKQKEKGYVLLLAVLISSIILAMSLGIFAISLKEVALATYAKDSVKAFAAASRGLECAMFQDRITRHNAFSAGELSTYYDSRTPLDYTPFVRGTNPFDGETWPVGAFNCASQSVTASTTATGPTSGNSSLQIDFGDSCTIVTIVKTGILTNFTSNGYSDNCASTNPRRTQRTISVVVNI